MLQLPAPSISDRRNPSIQAYTERGFLRFRRVAPLELGSLNESLLQRLTSSTRQIHQNNIRVVPETIENDLLAILRDVEALHQVAGLQIRKLPFASGQQVRLVEVPSAVADSGSRCGTPVPQEDQLL